MTADIMATDRREAASGPARYAILYRGRNGWLNGAVLLADSPEALEKRLRRLGIHAGDLELLRRVD